ncbi:hypothetical protein QTG54_012609 [Skeletonema marinoi]|uniref:SnoaL-like domain-containing protein n=1 Tax=Skeletonema marinoi TaxID=267567 RepID=A0AAD9D7A5_9STRA|nr:hypothetical protein QTG54_012609 [Skeletonema marinoi]
MMDRLMIRFPFAALVIQTILLSTAQAFLLATHPRQYQSSYLSTTNANDAPEDANINRGNSPLSAANVTARDVVVACMDGLLNNDTPWANSGLEICWDYSSDRNRAAQGGSFDEFITYASNPTFSTMVNAKEFSIENVGAYIKGTNTRGAMQTVLVKVQPLQGEERSFLWTMAQERRPPRQGLWLVHECINLENAIGLNLDFSF